jgi:hypothetical protein
MSNKPKMEMDDILNRWRSEKLASELDKEVCEDKEKF